VLTRYRDALPRLPLWGYPALLVAALVWPFLVSGYWVFLGIAASLFAIGALGITVLTGWCGQVSVAQGALVGTAVYLSGYAMRDDGWGWPLVPSLLVGIAVAVVLSCLVSLPTAKLSGIYVMILTLGLQVAIQRTVFTYPELAGSLRGSFLHRPHFLGLSFDSDRAYYFFVLAILAAAVVTLTLFRASRHGRAMLLVKTDRRAACAVGISPWRCKLTAFAIAGVLAGIAGGLTPPLFRSMPNSIGYTTVPSLLYLAVPVMAGFESLFAVVVTSYLVLMLPQALQSLHLSALILGGAGLLIATFIGPRGFGGRVLDLFEAHRQSPRPIPMARRPENRRSHPALSPRPPLTLGAPSRSGAANRGTGAPGATGPIVLRRRPPVASALSSTTRFQDVRHG
jgi:ABC-type branched-subunit amino acid transport system permease subunit